VRLLPLPGVFQPISDSMMLADRLAEEPIGPGSSVLDLCTGSGVLAITAAKLGASRAVAVDVSRRAVATAWLNARLNGVRITALRGDLFAPVGDERFDVIVSNPPYVPGELEAVPSSGLARAWEAGPDGRLFLDRICAGVSAHLKPGGVVLLVHSVICAEDETLRALAAAGLETAVVRREPGTLGPLMRQRAAWLRQRGLLGDAEHEEVIIVRGQLPRAAPQSVVQMAVTP
jgi:release factor glutamine methyltransferase